MSEGDKPEGEQVLLVTFLAPHLQALLSDARVIRIWCRVGGHALTSARPPLGCARGPHAVCSMQVSDGISGPAEAKCRLGRGCSRLEMHISPTASVSCGIWTRIKQMLTRALSC